MNMLLKWLTGVGLTLLLSMAQAADLAGRVIMVKGDVQASSPGGEVRKLSRRAQVFASDTITTGDNSRVQIRFVDKGLLALRANSQLNIKTYRQPNAAGDEGEVLMELVEGGFRTLTGTIGKGNKAAYKVDTPVASIGIRGTLYSVFLQKAQLFAGVWKGGISLKTQQGSFNLGSGANFDFAQIGSQGMQGLLTPPTELLPPPPPAAEQGEQQDDQPGNRLQGGQAPPPQQKQSSDPSVAQPDLPNAFDKDKDAGDEENLKQQIAQSGSGSDSGSGDDNPGNDGGSSSQPTSSPDARMTDSEYQAFLTTDTYGTYITPDAATAGTVFIDDDGKEVFVTLKDGESGVDVVRFAGESSNVHSPIANVSWGIWNGSAEQPIQQYTDPDSLTNTNLGNQAVWISSTPLRTSDLQALTGTVSFSGDSAAPGFDSRGQALNNVSGGFDLNLSNGAVSNGTLTATYGSGENLDSWNANFSGDIRPGTTTQNTPVLDLDITAGDHNGTLLNTSNSEIGGVLTAPANSGGAPGFAGGFHLEDNNGDSATGLVAWPGSQP